MQPGTGQTRTARRAERLRAARRRKVLAVAAFAVFVLVLAGVVLFATRGDGEDASLATATTITTAAEGSFTESPDDDVDFAALERSKFISVMVTGEDGIRAYSLTAEAPEFARLVELLPGREIDLNTGHDVDATIVFVDEERSTVSFELDLSEHLLVRNGRAWEVEPAVGDLVRSLSSRPS